MVHINRHLQIKSETEKKHHRRDLILTDNHCQPAPRFGLDIVVVSYDYIDKSATANLNVCYNG